MRENGQRTRRLSDAEHTAYFWARAKRRKNACWEWPIKRMTYGLITRHGQMYGTHVYSWTITFGSVPKGVCVLHTCDNRRCINPEHLFLGSKGDNNRDTFSKKRHYFGTRHWKVKLDPISVRVIRKRYRRGESQEKIGKDYGVSQAHISKVVRATAWRVLENCRGQ